jgi:hypothetical protein
VSDLERLIFGASDVGHDIHVYQDRRCRYLTFGNAAEQGCPDLADREPVARLFWPRVGTVAEAAAGDSNRLHLLTGHKPGATFGIPER